MGKELYLYSPIYDFVAEDLISKMDEYENEDITIRLNTPGGSVFAGWGIIAKMQERTKKTNLKLDGAVASMGSLIAIFGDYVESLDITNIMIHRADMLVESPEDQTFLDNVNKQLRSKLESKIDTKKLKELKGISIKDLFEKDERIDLWLTAKEAKQLGLVNKINTLTPKELTAFNNKMFSVAAEFNPSPINTIMTLEELKAKHPALFTEAVAVGVAQENDRIGACMVFAEIDLPGVKQAIESGKPLSAKQTAEFQLKMFSNKSLTALAGEGAKPLTTEEIAAKVITDKQKEMDAFEASAKTHLVK